MGITNFGIGEIGSLLRGDSTNFPDSIGFANGSDFFNGSISYFVGESQRKTVTWSTEGLTSKGIVVLSTTDSVGSNIQSLGLTLDSTALGSDVFTYEESAIGDKDVTFSVTVTQRIKFSRP